MVRFTADQKEFLKEFIPGHYVKEVKEEFEKRFCQTITEQQVRDFKQNNKIKAGVKHKFEKGHIPHNKGKKMPEDVRKKLEHTFFKSGHVPVNKDPIGTERESPDGYINIKVGENQWVRKHRLVWEQHNGKIPDGYAVMFLDGNKRNFDIDNLAMVSKAQQVIMNHHGLRYKDKDLCRTGIAIAQVLEKVAELKKKE